MRRQARLAEEFAAALAGRGVASARRDPALSPLLSLAQGLQALPLAAAPEFRDALRQRLLAVATVAPAPVPAPSPLERARTWVEGWRVQKAMATAAASMAGVVALTGVSVGASRSLPGDPLYGVKRSAEGVQLSLARNDVNRGKRHLQHAETRLHEVAKVVGEDIALGAPPVHPGQITLAFGGSRSERVSEGLHAMDGSTREGTKLLFEVYTEQQDDDVLRVVQDFTARQREHLGQVIDALPAAARADADASMQLVSQLHLRATQLLAVGTCGDSCATPKPVAPSPGSTALPTPTASPTFDDLGPVPCACPGDPAGTPEPTPEPTTPPSPTPTESASPDPEPTETTPTPTRTPYPLPSQIPSPVASPVQDVVADVEDTTGTTVPTPPPLPAVDAPLVPGVLPAAPKS